MYPLETSLLVAVLSYTSTSHTNEGVLNVRASNNRSGVLMYRIVKW